MFAMIGEWQASGLPQKEFCRRQGLKPATFAYWLKKYKSRQAAGTPSGFREILPPAFTGAEVCYPNGVVLRLPMADPDTLIALVRLF